MIRPLRIPGIALLLALAAASAARAASWKGLEPLVSRRADVVRVLGKPTSENAADASMHFATRDGEATVFLVTRDFAALKGWDPASEGTVVQIIVQHENARDTPKSLGLEGNRRFDREVRGDSVFYRNRKEGIIYIFKAGKLATTIYSPKDGGPGSDD
ncbi:MAG TPA: hypothetical protein VFW81_03585 [Thermoanaerobaculia bacterium]|nr:hypothetical protein [Thermoanaerobaculia bacterium]